MCCFQGRRFSFAIPDFFLPWEWPRRAGKKRRCFTLLKAATLCCVSALTLLTEYSNPSLTVGGALPAAFLSCHVHSVRVLCVCVRVCVRACVCECVWRSEVFRLCVRIAAYVCVCVNTHSVLEVCLCRRVRIQMQQNNNKKQCVSKLSKRTLPNSLLFFARACQRKRKEEEEEAGKTGPWFSWSVDVEAAGSTSQDVQCLWRVGFILHARLLADGIWWSWHYCMAGRVDDVL